MDTPDPPISQDPNSAILQGLDALKRDLRTLSGAPGVYRMIDGQGQVLYVGKAKNLKKRVTSYTQVDQLPLRLQRMVSQIHRLDIVVTHTEAEALLLEANLIQQLKPRYNIVFRDNKSFPYLLMTSDPFPRLQKYRGYKGEKGAYFGPFASSQDLALATTALHKAFLLRSCTDTVFQGRTRPCLQYDIKRCAAPCVAKISAQDYAVLVRQATQVLKGQSSAVTQALIGEMEALSAAQLYEKAARVRDRIQALSHIQKNQAIFSTTVKDADVIGVSVTSGLICLQIFFFRGGGNFGTKAFFASLEADRSQSGVLGTLLAQFYQHTPPPPVILLSHTCDDRDVLGAALSQKAGHAVEIQIPLSGHRKDLVDHARLNADEALSRHLATRESQDKIRLRLQQWMGIDSPLERIEVYDNSHLQGTDAYGTMVVVGPEGFQKAAYRKFALPVSGGAPAGGDDYDMMRTVMRRRFRLGAEAPNLPDLIMLDGGKGHLNAVAEVMKTLGLAHIPLLAIAKGPDRNAGREVLFRLDQPPAHLDLKDPLLYDLQRLRDEAHRFAIQTHRAKRIKNITTSKLDEIPGIGPKRKKMLLQHFGSLAGVQQAGVKDLSAVKGMNAALAQIIYHYYHP